MRKKTRWVIYGLILGIAILQLFQPQKNLGDRSVAEDLFKTAEVDKAIKDVLERSCYDCHSNYTNYPWYGYISPVSIFLSKHVNKGKEKLNFSGWGLISDKDKISRLVDIYESVESGEMPLQSYLIIHKEAALSEDDKEVILSWAEKEGEILFKKN